jgi:cyclophilin family peptidyl-prolyl cis-trans isomerase
MPFVAVLLALLAQATAPAQAPAPTPTPKPPPSGPFVALDVTQGHGSLGTIVIALNKEKAPLSVENFLQYVRDGHYDGTVFHRVMQNFMIQGGGYTPELVEKPTRPAIHNEARNGLRNSRGTVSMARTNDADSATSQFFINVRDNHSLDFGIRGAGYAVFGEVVEGMDIVDKIAATPTTTRPLRSATSTETSPGENAPQTSVVIRKAQELKSWTPPTPAPTPEPPKPDAPKP